MTKLPKNNDDAIWLPKAGSVWHGMVVSPLRRALIGQYRLRQNWLFGVSCFAPQWTASERTAFRKWRADFMRPMNGKAAKDQSRA